VGVRQVSCRQPKYVANDREVLRYYAFFQEPVVEAGDTDAAGFRVRKFVICYFTASGACAGGKGGRRIVCEKEVLRKACGGTGCRSPL
jgi:hypothetical protein